MNHASEWAQLDGQAAKLRGETIGKNPHPIGSPESRNWLAGWRETPLPRSANGKRSDSVPKPLTQWQETNLVTSEIEDSTASAMGCEAMLRAMLASGQHYYRLSTAEQIAKNIGMTTPVRKGIA